MTTPLAFVLTALCVAAGPPDGGGAAVQRLADPGFERVPHGPRPSGPAERGWEVQRVGRPEIQPALIVAGVADPGNAGGRALRLGLPANTVGFEYVTVGQRVRLRADREYEAAVRVRWPAGPGAAPAGAHAASGHPSAIASFWARHADGAGDFAGRDAWLFDRRPQRLTFRFRAADPARDTLVYLSLLPNQTPRRTVLLVDDFTLTEFPLPAAKPRTGSPTGAEGERVVAGGFQTLPAGPIPAGRSGPGPAAPGAWSFVPIGGATIAGVIVRDGDAAFARLTMSPRTGNLEAAQLRQVLRLKEGARYAVRCRMRWDNYAEDREPPIVNYGLYHEPTNTWYGPIDQVLKPSGKWETYRFVHVPPHAGPWRLYVQLNGWGNFGRGLTVSFDDFSCRPAED